MSTGQPPPHLTTDQRSELEGLILAAFGRAREKGKTDWAEMTTAVLKNRLRIETDGDFDEESYGAGRFLDLVEALPDLLSVDRSTQPPRVRLLRGMDGVETGALPTTSQLRLRPDLWDAVFDYTSGQSYVWRDDSAVITSDPESTDLILPTVSRQQLQDWRSEFAADHGDTEELQEWVGKQLGTSGLPAALRPQWNDTLKRRARLRLEEWFRDQGVQAPTDLMVPAADRTAAGRRAETEVDALRRYLQRCVSAMTVEELRTISIPVTVATRLHR